MKESLRVRFWSWVVDLGHRRLQAEWMERVRHDRCCPHCGCWASEVGGWTEHRPSSHPMLDWHACPACGHWSLWWEDMAPCPVDPFTLRKLPSFEVAREARIAAGPPDDTWTPLPPQRHS